MSTHATFRRNTRRLVILCVLLAQCCGCHDSENDSPPPPVEVEMVRIDGTAEFWAGSRSFPPMKSGPIDTFLMGATEITQAQYEAIMGQNPSMGTHGPSLPVQNVTWTEAVTFCNRLSKRKGLEPCYDESSGFACNPSRSGFRLPTSSEWEYACRGDATTPYFWGQNRSEEFCVAPLTIDELKPVKNKVLCSFAKPVKSKRPNRGLYDMIGNVAEWCEDTVQGNPHWRVYRGGSWENSDWLAFQSKWSSGMPCDNRLSTVGFRVVRKP